MKCGCLLFIVLGVTGHAKGGAAHFHTNSPVRSSCATRTPASLFFEELIGFDTQRLSDPGKGQEGWQFDLRGEFEPLPIINGHPGSFRCLLLREMEFFPVFFDVCGKNTFYFDHGSCIMEENAIWEH